MSSKVKVHLNRRNVLRISLGFDVSGDTITSEIRTEPSVDAPIIATWVVSFDTDGTDGELILTLDDSDLDEIIVAGGYMDLKRVSGGEPYPVFDRPLEVVFVGAVTA